MIRKRMTGVFLCLLVLSMIGCSRQPGTDATDASFQATVVDTIIDRLTHGICLFKEKYPQGRHLVVSGGVAANTSLRAALEKLAQKACLQFAAPPVKLCTDNGVMIAWAGIERLRLGLTNTLDFRARPRWPLDKPLE